MIVNKERTLGSGSDHQNGTYPTVSLATLEEPRPPSLAVFSLEWGDLPQSGVIADLEQLVRVVEARKRVIPKRRVTCIAFVAYQFPVPRKQQFRAWLMVDDIGRMAPIPGDESIRYYLRGYAAVGRDEEMPFTLSYRLRIWEFGSGFGTLRRRYPQAERHHEHPGATWD